MSPKEAKQRKKDWLIRIEQQVYGTALYFVQDEPRAVEIAKDALLQLYRHEEPLEEGSQEERSKVISVVLQASASLK